ncbi:MAG: acyl-CoA dehydrogenase family protein [Bacteroidota bacterium]|nr:acyl-CoA dehydrogenase family protein [Bacteroidota bacterium]MDW8137178.1 acyl-CoA dehydrogenase family protein [Bacteroidota bacterium]
MSLGDGFYLRAQKDFIAFIAENAPRWQAHPTLPEDVLAQLVERGLFKLFVPKSFGGLALSLREAAALYAALARADGSVAWLVQIGAGGGFFVPSFPPEVAKAFFSPQQAVIAGSGYPSGRAYRVTGGYRVSGTWRYASGAQYASLFTANAVLPEEGNAIRAFAFPREAVELIPDWHAMGMRATSSWSFRVTEVFVPEAHSFVVGEQLWDPGLPVYRIPFELFALVSIGAVAYGLVMAFLDEAVASLAHALERRQRVAAYRRKARWHGRILFGLISGLERAAGNGMTAQEQRQWAERIGVHLESMRRLTLAALPCCGMLAVQETSRLNRILRDMLAIGQHQIFRGGTFGCAHL